jgi:hypothetical protein
VEVTVKPADAVTSPVADETVIAPEEAPGITITRALVADLDKMTA